MSRVKGNLSTSKTFEVSNTGLLDARQLVQLKEDLENQDNWTYTYTHPISGNEAIGYKICNGFPVFCAEDYNLYLYQGYNKEGSTYDFSLETGWKLIGSTENTDFQAVFTTNAFVGSALGGLSKDTDLMGKSVKEILIDLLSVTVLDSQITTVQAPSLSASVTSVTISNPNDFDVQVQIDILETALPQYQIPGTAAGDTGTFENVSATTIPANGTLSVAVQPPKTEVGVLPTLKNYTYACYFKWHSYKSDTSSVSYS